MKLKSIWGLLPVALAVTTFFTFKVIDNNMRDNVIKSRINTTVTGGKINFIGGGKKYTTRINITIPLPHRDTLLIGDSVSKEVSSKEFNVYRKNKSGKYMFHTTFKVVE